ncbi:hypothetical protein JMT66_08640 [Kosakonia cowanii]|uniref:GTPase n=1 Tax=Kosakonia cowanii TaxID=208223 RepID=UPI001E5D3609|nr:GTPase [Kosakonia cowanii]UGS47697.1 hypothetical protein JMT66_08640 [Kosakonia cowanii]
MTLELKHPREIYQIITEELDQIINSLQSQSGDKDFDDTQADALKQLDLHQIELRAQLARLERNAEWNTFTVAFYGETGAGKSSIIETLRILLREPGKLNDQLAFRALQEKYSLSESNFQKLTQETGQAEKKLAGVIEQIAIVRQAFDQQHLTDLKHIESLQSQVNEHKRAASLWQKLLFSFRKLPIEIELNTARQQLQDIVASHECAIRKLLNVQDEAQQEKNDLIQKHLTYESHLPELDAMADGAIIGDGRSDFTRQTQRYNVELDGHKFALLDVPGIEGKEGLVLKEIEDAVQTAHAVFYVTNQPAPPQTGDDQRQGTLEKIKTHLKDQTEVWTIFNKKIINPMAIMKKPLLKDDEENSLAELDKKMHEQLGKNYRSVFPLSVLPAFLASTDHFAPDSQNAKRRKKFLDSFNADELFEISHMQAFIRMLSEKLLGNSAARIKAANFSQAKGRVDESNAKVRHIHEIISTVAEQLELDSDNSCKQLRQSFSLFRHRLEALRAKSVDELVSSVRASVYSLIDQDISSDEFKNSLRSRITQQQDAFSEKLKKGIQKDVEIFQQDSKDILTRFEQYSQELLNTYGKLGATKFNLDFDINIKMDNGINGWGLLAGLAGIALAPFTAGASLWVVGAAVLTSLISVGKALVGYFSTSYKQSQQRKATNENLVVIRSQLQTAIDSALEGITPQMQKTIDQLEQALKKPGQQVAAKARLLKRSTQKLDLLSRQISNTGNLP